MSEKQKPKQQLTNKERFENRQLAKRNAVENNPNAIVFVPESPVARRLVSAIMMIDSADAIMREQAGLNIDFTDFQKHIESYQAISASLEKTGQEMLNLIANNPKIQTRFIRNRFTQRAVEDVRKKNMKAANEAAKTEGEPKGPSPKK